MYLIVPRTSKYHAYVRRKASPNYYSVEMRVIIIFGWSNCSQAN